MKTPIDFGDIRISDEVERDLEGIASKMIVASRNELRIVTSSGAFLLNHIGSLWSLIDRPKPAVVLPSEPSLGWITAVGEASLAVTGIRGPVGGQVDRRFYHRIGTHGWGTVDKVTAFTPATAVPTEALDRLREKSAYWPTLSASRCFLAAVDAADGAAWGLT